MSDDTKSVDPPITTTTDFFSGLATGLITPFGFGEFYNTYSDLQTASKTAQDGLQNNFNDLTIEVLKSQEKFDSEIVNTLARNTQLINKNMNYYSTIANNNYYENNIYIKISSIIIFIILFFMLIK